MNRIKLNKIGILGGTFDPVHYGHLETAKSLMKIRNLSKIIFVPCNISPHKTGIASSPPEHRLKMLELALANYTGFEYSGYEINKGDISFTLDTLRHFKKLYNNIELIIGFDNIIKFDDWKQPDEIFRLAEVVVMKRKTDTTVAAHKYFRMATFVETPRVDISSTEIRNRIAGGKSIEGLVTPEVEKYIFENKLFNTR